MLLAGIDFPEEEERLARGSRRPRLGGDARVSATTRSPCCAPGTERGWGVAITCGAGINCVGVAPDGRHVRFPALGAITGDWGGGHDVGEAGSGPRRAARTAAARSTQLEQLVPAHFGLDSPLELAQRDPRGAIAMRRLVELAPVVLRSCADDAVAAGSATGWSTRSSRSRAPRSTRLGLDERGGRGRRRRRADARAPTRGLLGRDRAGASRSRRRARAAPDEPAADRRRGAARPRRGRRRARGAGARASRARRGGRTTRDGWRWADGCRAVRAGDEDLRRHRRTGGRRARPDDRRRRVPRPRRSVGIRARRRRCGCSPGSRRSMPARSSSATVRSPISPPKQRDVAMVFQNYALYPYLTVAANIAFPLRIARVAEGGARAADARGRAAARARAVPRAQARPAVGRPAAAGRDGARDHPRAERVPDGRAAVEPRREAARPDARRDRLAAGAGSGSRRSTSRTTSRRR